MLNISTCYCCIYSPDHEQSNRTYFKPYIYNVIRKEPAVAVQLPIKLMLTRRPSLFQIIGLLGIFHFYSTSYRTFCNRTVENLIRRRVLRRLVWFCTVCRCPIKNYYYYYSVIVSVCRGPCARGIYSTHGTPSFKHPLWLQKRNSGCILPLSYAYLR